MVRILPLLFNERMWNVRENYYIYWQRPHATAYRLAVEEVMPNVFLEIGITNHKSLYLMPVGIKRNSCRIGKAFGWSFIDDTNLSLPEGRTFVDFLRNGEWVESLREIRIKDKGSLWSHANAFYKALKASKQMEMVGERLAQIFAFTQAQHTASEPDLPPFQEYYEIAEVVDFSRDTGYGYMHLGIGIAPLGLPFHVLRRHSSHKETHTWSLYALPIYEVLPHPEYWLPEDAPRAYINCVEPSRAFGDKMEYLLSLPAEKQGTYTTLHVYFFPLDDINPGFYVWKIGMRETGIAGIVLDAQFITFPPMLFFRWKQGVPIHRLLTPEDTWDIVFSYLGLER